MATNTANWLKPAWWQARQEKKALLAFVRARDGDRCWLCDRRMGFRPPFNMGKAATVEHLLAKSLGGTSQPFNLRLCHRRCSKQLGAKPPEQKERMRASLAREQVSRAVLG